MAQAEQSENIPLDGEGASAPAAKIEAKRENRELVTRVTSIAALFQHLERFVPHETEAWIDAGST